MPLNKEIKPYFFQEDRAPCHTRKVAKTWKEMQGIKSLIWVAQNPDMNPKEFVWEQLDRKLWEHATKISSVAALKEALLKQWQNIDKAIVDNLIKSMKNWMQASKISNGGPSPYYFLILFIYVELVLRN